MPWRDWNAAWDCGNAKPQPASDWLSQIVAYFMIVFNKIRALSGKHGAKELGRLGRVITLVRSQPGTVLVWVLTAHLLLWTVLPILICHNLQLDLAEDLALGKEWQLGYWKHPPLPWWVADLAYRLVGHVDVVYLLGPLSAVVSMYFVWRFAREMLEPTAALIAVLTLEGIHFYNFSVPKFAHDHTLMVFWVIAVWFFHRALAQGRYGDWIIAGAALAGCFWSKYTAVTMSATLGLVLLCDPFARRAWRTSGPYLMAATFLVVLAPHIWWLVDSGFQPLHYVDTRAVVATRWYQHLTFPLFWTASQFLAIVPALGLLSIVLYRAKRRMAGLRSSDTFAFNRRYVTAVALGPFLITAAASVVLGRLPIAMWGFAIWSFAPLALLVWVEPITELARLRWYVQAFLLVFLGFMVVYAAVELGEPLVRDRPKATQFPGQLLAQEVTRQWRETTGSRLTYVAGVGGSTGAGEFAVNNVAVYSADHPHVVVHGDLRLSPWIDPVDLRRRGAVVIWQALAPGLPDDVRDAFPSAQLQPALVLPRWTLVPRAPEVIYYAFVLPQP